MKKSTYSLLIHLLANEFNLNSSGIAPRGTFHLWKSGRFKLQRGPWGRDGELWKNEKN